MDTAGQDLILDAEDLARMVHEANRAYQAILRDIAPDPPYDSLPEWNKEMIRQRVDMIRAGYGPEEIHRAWVKFMLDLGWELGDVKDPAGAPPVHPCLRDWAELPLAMRRKDVLACQVVAALTGQ